MILIFVPKISAVDILAMMDHKSCSERSEQEGCRRIGAHPNISWPATQITHTFLKLIMRPIGFSVLLLRSESMHFISLMQIAKIILLTLSSSFGPLKL